VDKLRFVSPIRIGDTVHVDAEIVEKREIPNDLGILTTRIQLRNQRGELVLSARMKGMAGRRSAAAKAEASGVG
jgi:acyl dehydratase